MAVKTIGVVGAGQMGAGIAQVAAQAGLDVVMHDLSEDFLRRGIESIGRNLDRMIERGRFKPEDRERVLKRIRTTTRYEEWLQPIS